MENKKLFLRIASVILLALVLTTTLALPIMAATPVPKVDDVIIDATEEITLQVKDIFFEVVVVVLRIVVGILLIVFMVQCGISHKNGQDMNLSRPIICFVILIALFVLPDPIWNMIT